MSRNQVLTKVALITGAAGGIGHAMADAFMANGYTVLALDIANKPETLDCHHYIQADLSRYAAEEPTLTRDDWQRTLNVNLLAPFFLTQALVGVLAEAGGSVVNISSIHASLTKRQFVAYATSKAALSAMTRSMCLELGQRFRVNAIEPAAIETEMLKKGLVPIEGAYETLKDYHPAGRIGCPNEVARATVWLCSDESDFINGACVQIDGGISNILHDPT